MAGPRDQPAIISPFAALARLLRDAVSGAGDHHRAGTVDAPKAGTKAGANPFEEGGGFGAGGIGQDEEELVAAVADRKSVV